MTTLEIVVELEQCVTGTSGIFLQYQEHLLAKPCGPAQYLYKELQLFSLCYCDETAGPQVVLVLVIMCHRDMSGMKKLSVLCLAYCIRHTG